MHTASSRHLSYAEWGLSLMMMSFLFSLFVIAKCSSFRGIDRPDFSQIRERVLVDIEITGCVAKPGHYQMIQGTSFREAIKKARPRSYADLTSIPSSLVVEGPCILKVLSLENIQVRVVGCVENPGAFQMPAGSRVCNLASRVRVKSQGDRKIFKSKKILKDQEVIFVEELVKKAL